MQNNRRQILDMLAEGKIGVEEAERLLSLVSPEGESAGSLDGDDPALTNPCDPIRST